MLLECCQESLQCENLDHVKFRFQPTLTTNSRSRPRHEEDQAVSTVSALLKVQRDKYDHYCHHVLIFVVKRHNRVHSCIYRGLLLTWKTTQQCARSRFSIIIGRLLQNICITDDHGYVPSVMDTQPPCYLVLH